MKHRPAPEFAKYVAKVMACGHWEDAMTCRGNHVADIRHIATGKTISYQLHSGNDRYAARNMAKDAQKICGCRFVETLARRRSRKKVESSGFDPHRAHLDNIHWADKWGGNIAGLIDRRENAIERIRELAVVPCRKNATLAHHVLDEIRELEDQLTRFGQCPHPFDITDLGDTA